MSFSLRVTFLILCLGYCIHFSYAQAPRSSGTYFKGNLDQLRQQAKSQQKPYIIFFHADWSEPSSKMESECIMNQRVGQILRDKFLLLKVEPDTRATDNKLGQLANIYEVSLYPTFIFFAADGRILTKRAGHMDASSFADELLDNYESAQKREEAEINGKLGEEEDKAWTPKEYFQDDEELILEKDYTAPEAEVEIFDEYEEKPEEFEGPSEMYAVQVGAYSQINYAQQRLDEIQRQSNFPVQIKEQYVNGKRYFKVLIGPYPSRGKAEQQRQQVINRLGAQSSFIIAIPRY